jgi:hypothetical protein
MIRKVITCASLIFSALYGISQTPTFDFILNTRVTESISYAMEYPDNNYYFVGSRKIDSSSWENGALIITSDQFGDTSMHFFYFQDTSISIKSLISRGDNLLAFGSYEIYEQEYKRGLINIIFNFDLNLISKKIFPYPPEYKIAWSTIDDILVDPQGNCIRILTLNQQGNCKGDDGGDICLYKFGPDVDTINTRLYKIPNGQSVDAACFNSDSTEIWVFGSGFTGSAKQWVRFDMDFNLISISDFYDQANYPLSIIPGSSDTWVGWGTFPNVINRSYYDMWAFRMDCNGNLENDTIFGTPDTNEYASFGRGIARDNEGNIFISGTHNVTVGFFPNVKSWISLTKLDADFNHVFTHYYNPDDKYYLNFDISACSDGGILLCNLRYDSDDNVTPPLQMDAWVLKVDNNGLLTGINEGSGNVKNALIYPNPGDNTINVICTWPYTTLKLYSSDGKLILSRELNHSNTIVNTSSFGSEIYFWTLTQRGNKLIESGKWIKK